MSTDKMIMTCPKCQKPFAIVKPDAPGMFIVQCPRCQGKIRLRLQPAQVRMAQPQSDAAPQTTPTTTHEQQAPASAVQQQKDNNEEIPLLGKATLSNRGVYFVKEPATAGEKSRFDCPECGKSVVVNNDKPGKYYVKCAHCNNPTIVKVVEKENKTDKAGKVKKPTRKVQSDTTAERGQLVWGNLFRRRRHELRNGSTVIGRNDSNETSDLMFDDPTMSCRSVRIDVNANDGTCLLTVLHATNPVSVNGVNFPEGSSIYLNFNDTLKMGSTVIVYSKLK